MSGVSLKRLRDGSSGVALKASADLERRAESSFGGVSSSHSTRGAGRDVNDDDDDSNNGGATFSYLFSSPAERKAERDAKLRKQREEERKRRIERERVHDPLAGLSKHQRALHEAQQRGLQLEGMSRKEKRGFLQLTVSKQQQEAQQRAKDFKLHELMDEKLAWYQQGPYPIDLIAERLVIRKAEKKGKRLGIRYNYLLPHPSWVARRAQRRREGLLVGLGRRFVFDEEGQAMDPIRNVPVDLTKVNLLLSEPVLRSEKALPTDTPAAAAAAVDGSEAGEARMMEGDAAAAWAALNDAENDTSSSSAASEEVNRGDDGEGAQWSEENGSEASENELVADAEDIAQPSEVTERRGKKRKPPASSRDGLPKRKTTKSERHRAPAASAAVSSSTEKTRKTRSRGQTTSIASLHSSSSTAAATSTVTSSALPSDALLVDPLQARNSFVRAVVRDRAAALALQKANLSTNFLSSALVNGPSIGQEEREAEEWARGAQHVPPRAGPANTAVAGARMSSANRVAVTSRRTEKDHRESTPQTPSWSRKGSERKPSSDEGLKRRRPVT